MEHYGTRVYWDGPDETEPWVLCVTMTGEGEYDEAASHTMRWLFSPSAQGVRHGLNLRSDAGQVLIVAERDYLARVMAAYAQYPSAQIELRPVSFVFNQPGMEPVRDFFLDHEGALSYEELAGVLRGPAEDQGGPAPQGAPTATGQPATPPPSRHPREG